MTDPSSDLEEEEEEGVEVEDTWEWWNRLHTLCSTCRNLSLGELGGVQKCPKISKHSIR